MHSPHINSFHHLWRAVGAPPFHEAAPPSYKLPNEPLWKGESEAQHTRGWMHLIRRLRTKRTLLRGRVAKGRRLWDKDGEAPSHSGDDVRPVYAKGRQRHLHILPTVAAFVSQVGFSLARAANTCSPSPAVSR